VGAAPSAGRRAGAAPGLARASHAARRKKRRDRFRQGWEKKPWLLVLARDPDERPTEIRLDMVPGMEQDARTCRTGKQLRKETTATKELTGKEIEKKENKPISRARPRPAGTHRPMIPWGPIVPEPVAAKAGGRPVRKRLRPGEPEVAKKAGRKSRAAAGARSGACGRGKSAFPQTESAPRPPRLESKEVRYRQYLRGAARSRKAEHAPGNGSPRGALHPAAKTQRARWWMTRRRLRAGRWGRYGKTAGIAWRVG